MRRGRDGCWPTSPAPRPEAVSRKSWRAAGHSWSHHRRWRKTVPDGEPSSTCPGSTTGWGLVTMYRRWSSGSSLRSWPGRDDAERRSPSDRHTATPQSSPGSHTARGERRDLGAVRVSGICRGAPSSTAAAATPRCRTARPVAHPVSSTRPSSCCVGWVETDSVLPTVRNGLRGGNAGSWPRRSRRVRPGASPPQVESKDRPRQREAEHLRGHQAGTLRGGLVGDEGRARGPAASNRTRMLAAAAASVVADRSRIMRTSPSGVPSSQCARKCSTSLSPCSAGGVSARSGIRRSMSVAAAKRSALPPK